MDKYKLTCGCIVSIDDNNFSPQEKCKYHSHEGCWRCNANIDHEYFMIHDDLWKRVCGDDSVFIQLCLDCVESRLGRCLNRDDFTHCAVNQVLDKQSRALIQRLINPSPDCQC